MPQAAAYNQVPQKIFQGSFSGATIPGIGPILIWPWKAIMVVFDQIVLTGGTTPSLQEDLVTIFPDDGTTLDYYNNGPHTTASFFYVVGPVANSNTPMCPYILQLNSVIAGAPTNVAFRVTIFGIM